MCDAWIDSFGNIATETVTVIGELHTPQGKVTDGQKIALPLIESLRLRRLGKARLARRMTYHEVHAQSFTRGPDYPFPEPWFPRQMIGEYELIPIERAADLYAESLNMQHCVGVNARAVYDGNQFAFSLRQNGARVATLLLAREPPWISDVKGYRHATVPEIAGLISTWIARQPTKIRELEPQ